MKDLSHHRRHTQRKVLREVRQLEAEKETRLKVDEEHSIENEPIEVEDQPLVTRPLNRRFH